jgi:hypothetical protein
MNASEIAEGLLAWNWVSTPGTETFFQVGTAQVRVDDIVALARAYREALGVIRNCQNTDDEFVYEIAGAFLAEQEEGKA